MNRKKIRKDVNLSIMIDKHLKDQLDRMAEEEGRTRSDVIRRLVTAGIQKGLVHLAVLIFKYSEIDDFIGQIVSIGRSIALGHPK